jgi:hypothetical protein
MKVQNAKSVEWWVMRVLFHNGAKMTATNLDTSTVALVNAGTLALLPDLTVAEPVMCFGEEMDAHAYREQLAADKPSEDYRVILNADVTV